MDRYEFLDLIGATGYLKALIATPLVIVALFLYYEPVGVLLAVGFTVGFIYVSKWIGYPRLPLIYYFLVALGIFSLMLPSWTGNSFEIVLGLAFSAFWPLVLPLEAAANGGLSAGPAYVCLFAVPISLILAVVGGPDMVQLGRRFQSMLGE